MVADDALLDLLQLNLVPGIGPRLQQVLLARFETPAGILAASVRELQQAPGIGPKLAMSIAAARNRDEAVRELETCRAKGVDLIPRGSSEYPALLEKIPDPPSLLYCRGRVELQDALAVAIVGSRRCTAYGLKYAERLAMGLSSAGITVVSGLARGIDAAAHRGALKTGGRTFAVTATGLATVYPPEHHDLAEEIAGQGALLTESCLHQAPVPGLFPQRNRIISGLSLGVIVVEAARDSGALHTARHAMEQGRDIFAVPGRIDSQASEGCHDLIRDGAALVRGVDDVLEALGPLMQPVRRSDSQTVFTPRELNLSDQEQAVLNLIPQEPVQIDAILRTAGMEPSRVLSTLTVLEMKRLLRRLPGGYLVRQ